MGNKRLVLGGTCGKGHYLDDKTIKNSVSKNGEINRYCGTCRAELRSRNLIKEQKEDELFKQRMASNAFEDTTRSVR